MAKTVADVMKMVKENEVKFVDFRFTDTRGKQQHTTVPVSHFDEDKFISGHAFDGSSIAGWKGIEASDMQLIPDPNSANIDPFFEETTLLLPGFDEYVLGYADRLFAMADDHHRRLVPGNNGVFKRSVVIGGRVVGTWTRAGRPGGRTLEIDGFVPISEAARSRLEARYGEFPFAAD